MTSFGETLREFYGPALRESLKPSPLLRPQLIVVYTRWWDRPIETVTWRVRS